MKFSGDMCLKKILKSQKTKDTFFENPQGWGGVGWGGGSN